jgi:hypothetical protein
MLKKGMEKSKSRLANAAFAFIYVNLEKGGRGENCVNLFKTKINSENNRTS